MCVNGVVNPPQDSRTSFPAGFTHLLPWPFPGVGRAPGNTVLLSRAGLRIPSLGFRV